MPEEVLYPHDCGSLNCIFDWQWGNGRPSIALMDGDSGYRRDKRCGWMRMDFATGVMQGFLALE